MKVLLVNGSPHDKGCTYTALEAVADTLNNEGIETEIYQIGTKPLAGCIGCRKCAQKGRCLFDDSVNNFVDLAQNADGFVFGSPVHYASAGGAITSFMDRALLLTRPTMTGPLAYTGCSTNHISKRTPVKDVLVGNDQALG